MDNSRVVIYTRSANNTLYEKSSFLINLPFKKKRLLGTTAEGYIESIIWDQTADWVINIDEDAFVFDSDCILNLLHFCIENGIVNCGMPDGGVVNIRRANPLVTNPFFNILFTKKLRENYSKKAISNFPLYKDEYMNKFAEKSILQKEYNLINVREPYYPIFIWISQNFPTLYLNALEHSDNESTILLDKDGKPFLIHTWYSRFYGKNLFHTARINQIFNECLLKAGLTFKGNFITRYFPYVSAYYYSLIARLAELKKHIHKTN